MGDVLYSVSGSAVISERFTGQVRWLSEAGTTTRPPKLQQRVEVTKHEDFGFATEQTYEWRDVPFEVAPADGGGE
jgi:hypothetical protein